jgi:hypothetical protein
MLDAMKSIGDFEQLKYRPRPGAAKGERAERPHPASMPVPALGRIGRLGLSRALKQASHRADA